MASVWWAVLDWAKIISQGDEDATWHIRHNVNSDWFNNNPTGGLDGIPPYDKSFHLPSRVARLWRNLGQSSRTIHCRLEVGVTWISAVKAREHKRKPLFQNREKIAKELLEYDCNGVSTNPPPPVSCSTIPRLNWNWDLSSTAVLSNHGSDCDVIFTNKTVSSFT
jgi:hypothetical protein